MNAAERPEGPQFGPSPFPCPAAPLRFATMIAGGVAVWDLYINGFVSRRWLFLVIAIAILSAVIVYPSDLAHAVLWCPRLVGRRRAREPNFRTSGLEERSRASRSQPACPADARQTGPRFARWRGVVLRAKVGWLPGVGFS